MVTSKREPNKQELEPFEFVANYDLNKDYFYKGFWKGREYEHYAEVILLEHIFNKYIKRAKRGKKQRRGIFLDLGAAFGRLTPYYKDWFKVVVLGDYSLKELSQAYEKYRKEGNLYFVGLNAYKMPFKDSSIDYILSVRLAHHIKYMDLFANELYRVLKPGGLVIIEVANKNHIKAVLRALLKRDFKFFSKKFVEVEHRSEQSQGIDESKGQIPIMFNFSYRYIKEIFSSVGFKLEATYPCSFFRLPLLKRFVNIRILLFLEKFLQRLRFLKFTPSLFYVFRKPQVNEGMGQRYRKFENLLVCPNHEPISFSQDRILCRRKDLGYRVVSEDFYDLREPRPEKVNF